MDLLAFLFLRTAVTDVWRSFERLTFGRIEFRTQSLTVVFPAELTAVKAAVRRFRRAEILPEAASVSGTAVGRQPVVISGIGTVVLHFS